MEEAKSQSLEEDFEGQASHTGKQSQKKKTTVKLKLNLEISYCHCCCCCRFSRFRLCATP